VVADGKAFQILQALGAAQDPEHRNQQQEPGWDANAPSHASVQDRLKIASQIMLTAAATDPWTDFESALGKRGLRPPFRQAFAACRECREQSSTALQQQGSPRSHFFAPVKSLTAA
jgi:hypothetical protein